MHENNDSDAERKERIYEDQIASRYNRDYHSPPVMAAHSEAFAEFAAKFIQPGDRVLDLGCASASLWPVLYKTLPQDIHLVGVDLSPKMLEEAKSQYPEADFREGSMLSIPYGPGEFDAVIVSSAFHHIHDKHLPSALTEVNRVLDEHGILIGREPLSAGRLGDRGGWVAGALMHLRHLAYRLTHTREYPEPDPGPDHHAYVAEPFLKTIDSVLRVVSIEFRNPASLFLARIQEPIVVRIAKHLDDLLGHREGQEVHYAARKNFSTAKDVSDCIQQALAENKITNMEEFLSHVAAAAQILEKKIADN